MKLVMASQVTPHDLRWLYKLKHLLKTQQLLSHGDSLEQLLEEGDTSWTYQDYYLSGIRTANVYIPACP